MKLYVSRFNDPDTAHVTHIAGPDDIAEAVAVIHPNGRLTTTGERSGQVVDSKTGELLGYWGTED